MANTPSTNFSIPKPAVGDLNWGDEYHALVDLIDSRMMMTGFKNAVINGNFNINQRGVAGTVVLSAGAYGHDRWKAGASGCTYTFATSENVTTITISSGSLVQVVEGLNLLSGTYILSWGGTAQGKIDGGSFGATGVTGTATGGTNLTVEFNAGTLSKVQLEAGGYPTGFEMRPVASELALCKRYLPAFNEQPFSFAGQCKSATEAFVTVPFPVTARVAPTGIVTSVISGGNFQVTAAGGAGQNVTGISLIFNNPENATISVTTASGLVAGNATIFFSANDTPRQLLFTGCEL